jgi:filamentous hemagglutinin family protein
MPVVPGERIQNIFTRITGNNPSEINGILGTISNLNFEKTNANLFLINPNGIVFGENGSLDTNGSFVELLTRSPLVKKDFLAQPIPKHHLY